MKTSNISINALMLLLLLSPFVSCLAQEKEPRIKAYRVKVKTDEGKRYKGFLLKVDTSTVTVVRRFKAPHRKMTAIAVSDIDKIKLRRRGKVLKSAGIGLAAGALVGAIFGFADGDDPPCRAEGLFDCLFYVQNTAEEKALGNAIVIGFFGALTGALVGTGWKKFWLQGNELTIQRYLREVKLYSIEDQLARQTRSRPPE